MGKIWHSIRSTAHVCSIYKEIGPGKRIALSKFAANHFQTTGRPLRLAIDTSIWLFQIQSGKGRTIRRERNR
jgi:Holliday junction resolvase YEN1